MVSFTFSQLRRGYRYLPHFTPRDWPLSFALSGPLSIPSSGFHQGRHRQDIREGEGERSRYFFLRPSHPCSTISSSSYIFAWQGDFLLNPTLPGFQLTSLRGVEQLPTVSSFWCLTSLFATLSWPTLHELLLH